LKIQVLTEHKPILLLRNRLILAQHHNCVNYFSKTKLFGFPKDQRIVLEEIQRLEFLLCH